MVYVTGVKEIFRMIQNLMFFRVFCDYFLIKIGFGSKLLFESENLKKRPLCGPMQKSKKSLNTPPCFRKLPLIGYIEIPYDHSSENMLQQISSNNFQRTKLI